MVRFEFGGGGFADFVAIVNRWLVLCVILIKCFFD